MDNTVGIKLINDGEAQGLKIAEGQVVTLYSGYGVEGVFDSGFRMFERIQQLRKMAAYQSTAFHVQYFELNGGPA